jgi:hypothetical protein
MRVIFVSLGVLFVVFLCVLITKFWGKSQSFVDYSHPFTASAPADLRFVKPSYEKLEAAIESESPLFLDVGITRDGKLVLPKADFKKPIRNADLSEIKDQVLLLSDFSEKLRSRRIIFNILDSVIAVHEVFVHGMKEIGYEKGENFLVTSEYEQPVKTLKELMPSWLYGSSRPEILKIMAMQSMFVLEAATIRADFVIHPLMIRKQKFFNDDLLNELKRRHKRFIVGPISPQDEAEARLLQPFAVIVKD